MLYAAQNFGHFFYRDFLPRVCRDFLFFIFSLFAL